MTSGPARRWRLVTRSNGSRAVGLYGDDATGRPLTDDVMSRIGSITKSFTATTVMMLVDDGLLDLDDEVAQHLDSQLVPAGATVRKLLQHTSGIPDYVDTLNVVRKTVTRNSGHRRSAHT